MAYLRSIPQPSHNLSVSQGNILGNFQAIDSGTTGSAGAIGFSRNHVTMDDNTNGGLHYRVDYYQAVSDPVLATIGAASSLYAKQVSSPELFYRSSSGDPTQITSGSLPIWKGGTSGGTGIITATVSQNGQLNLPNGLQFRWGRGTALNNGDSVSFSPAFSSSCFSIQVTGQRGNNDVRSLWVGPSPSASSFQVFTSISGIDIWYFAVGN